MTGLRIIARKLPPPPDHIFGCTAGGHIKCFPSPKGFDAYYYGGAGLGFLFGPTGKGETPAEAVRDLWRQLHAD